MGDSFPVRVAVVGGAGHVGLPLALCLADAGLATVVHDVDEAALKELADARMPFAEPGAAEVLGRVLAAGTLTVSSDPAVVGRAEAVVVVIGTPVDGHLNPDPQALPRALALAGEHFVDGQLLVLRSTVYPGTTALVERMVAALGRSLDVVFCPERIAEGRAMTELRELPQLVGARTAAAAARAADLFRALDVEVVHLSPEEAELAKLFTNTWRYITFATANQLYMIANDAGLDYERIRGGLTAGYPRAAALPRAGFAAGPCLYKDTAQLAAFNSRTFTLGSAAMTVNEGLPLYVVSRLEQRYDLADMTVGILGMAFKAESDDVRASLSYKLRRILAFKAAAVVGTDPHVSTDPTLLPLAEVLRVADLLVLGAPHRCYADLVVDVPVVDVWGLRGDGVRV